MRVFEDDTFIVSYPRSGNTWMRFLFASLLWPDGSTDFENLNERIPDIYQTAGKELARHPRPRIIKSHARPRGASYPNVIYIVRDPRQVVVSYYHYLKNQGQDVGDIMGFTRWLIDGHDGFGPWHRHVEGWLKRDVCLIRYRDLKRHTAKVFAKAAAFAQIESRPGQIKRAVGLSRFERLKQMDPVFIRSGKVAGFKKFLPLEVIRLIESVYGPQMERLGYELLG